MDDQLILKNRLKVARAEKGLSQTQLAELVGVSRQAGADSLHRLGQEVRGTVLF